MRRALEIVFGSIFGAGAVMALFWSLSIIAWAAGWE